MNMNDEEVQITMENLKAETYIEMSAKSLMKISPFLDNLQKEFNRLVEGIKPVLMCPRCLQEFKTEESIDEHFSYTNHRMSIQDIRQERLEREHSTNYKTRWGK